MRTEVHASREAACCALARELAELLRSKPDAVLGLPTGHTPVPLYRELARLYREERLSFARVRTFNLDEYLGLPEGDPRSFRAWMQGQFLGRVDLAPENAHFPSDESFAQALRAAGGIDLQLLGVGRNGHIGFNEPGSARDSRMRVVELAPETREDAAQHFGGLARVPVRAITLGVADILDARAIRVLAFGAAKAGIVRRMLEEPPGPGLPAGFLRGHADVRILLDAEAASGLSRWRNEP
jgi:glucosamine-6-phosphate deaminase